MSSQSVAATQPNSGEPLDQYYQSFFEMEVPPGTSASQAWFGRIRPFKNDDDARKLLRQLDRNMQVDVDQGTLIPASNVPDLPVHNLESLLASTGMTFSLVVLNYEKRHPEAFCVAPYIDEVNYPGHPHLRLDRVFSHRGRRLPALCVYSPAEYTYSANVPRLIEFLDQTATYLAKHVIWLKTRRLHDIRSGRLIYAPKIGEAIIDTEARDPLYVPGISPACNRSSRVWLGFWPGKVAAMGPLAHTHTIGLETECWCGSGEKYSSCHRPRELALLRLAG